MQIKETVQHHDRYCSHININSTVELGLIGKGQALVGETKLVQ